MSWTEYDAKAFVEHGTAKCHDDNGILKALVWFTCPRCERRQIARITINPAYAQEEVYCTNTAICGEGNFYFTVEYDRSERGAPEMRYLPAYSKSVNDVPLNKPA